MGKRHKKPAPGMTNQGVLDLDSPGWKSRCRGRLTPKPATPWVMPESATENREVADLIYEKLSQEDKEQILSLWPKAEFEQEYDFIHEWRTQVRLPGCSVVSWYRFLVRSGLAAISLAFELSMHTELDLVEAVLDAEKPGWRTRKHGKTEEKLR